MFMLMLTLMLFQLFIASYCTSLTSSVCPFSCCIFNGCCWYQVVHTHFKFALLVDTKEHLTSKSSNMIKYQLTDSSALLVG